MAKPIVSTDVGDVSRFVTNYENGFTVPVGDLQKLVLRLETLIDDKKLRETMGARSREVAIDELDIMNCANSHLLTFSEILDK